MPSKPCIISADGKRLHGNHIGSIKAGDTIKLVIDGNQMVGGAESPTLLGNGQTFLPSSMQFTLSEFEPQADGTCLLSYMAS